MSPPTAEQRLPEYILTLSCPDQRGIVHRVSGLLAASACNILDSAQYGDPLSQRFFMRVHVAAEDPALGRAQLQQSLCLLAQELKLLWQLHDARAKPRLMILVSKIGHCLNDLLFRWQSGLLPVDIRAIVSNHADFAALAASYQIPFHHLPLPAGASAEDKRAQEARLLQLAREQQVDLLVLARYMQILSPGLCRQFSGRAINIHHSFLPSFKGASPYRQAHERGVKLIGATAHFVTGDLDEGPIIEQDIARVDHAMTPEQLSAVGRDVECVVLARAVKCFVERRILLNGSRTVVFR